MSKLKDNSFFARLGRGIGQLSLLCCFFLGNSMILKADGLLFYGNTYPVGERTSYRVFEENDEPDMNGQLRLSFDIRIKDFNTFGYIFHLRDLISGHELSLTFTYRDEAESVFQFNSDGHAVLASVRMPNDSIRNRWLPVELTLDLCSGKITLSVNRHWVTASGSLGFNGRVRPELYFGSTASVVDLPTFALRKLTLTDDSRTYAFPLDESHGNRVHDSEGTPVGEVVNPFWLITQAYHWKPLLEKVLPAPVGGVFDAATNSLYFFSSDSLYVSRLPDGDLSQVAYNNKLPVRMRLGTSFLSADPKKLYVYEVNGLPAGETTMAALDLQTLMWQPVSSCALPVQLHHHNSLYDKQTDRLLIFGGYGNQRYHDRLLSYDLSQDRFDTLALAGDHITPRFCSGMLSVGDSVLYVYGGIGNDTGEQAVGWVYRNDLYRIDLKRRQVDCCWNHPVQSKEAVAATMVSSDGGRTLYALRYKEYQRESFFQLYRIAADTGDMMAVGDSVPFLSVAIETAVDLYYSSDLGKLYCVVQEHHNTLPDTVRLGVYELDFPPLTPAELMAFQHAGTGSFNVKVVASVLAALVLLGCLVWGIWRVRRKKTGPLCPKEQEVGSVTASQPVVCRNKQMKIERNAIWLFGPFTVIDRDGKDISHLFSNKIRQLFVYLLVEGGKDGVLSSSLNAMFWPDKDEAKVKNLKGVTINHLRKIITDIDGVSLDYAKGRFVLTVTPECYCDYLLLDDEEDDSSLLSVVSRGKFLNGLNGEVFDLLKSGTENRLLERLTYLLECDQNGIGNAGQMILCRSVLQIDPLNEQALSVLIRTYVRLGMIREAREAYSRYAKDYRTMMGQNAPVAFEKLAGEGFVSD